MTLRNSFIYTARTSLTLEVENCIYFRLGALVLLGQATKTIPVKITPLFERDNCCVIFVIAFSVQVGTKSSLIPLDRVFIE